jgi:hypothetical protein
MAIFKGNGRLEEAVAVLIQNQAAFLARATESDRRLSDLERTNAERFARLEALLLRHEQRLQELTDAIREKIGFKSPGAN